VPCSSFFRIGGTKNVAGDGEPDCNGHRGGAVCHTGAGPSKPESASVADFPFFGPGHLPQHANAPPTYDSVSHARRSIGNYLNWYNQNRPHSSLSDQTPDEAYFATLPAIKSAA
jgi:hypothetical protein